MARRKLELGPLAQAIYNGEHDDELYEIIAAASARQKNRFRKGSRVTVHGSDAIPEGAEGVVLKVNSKTISVGIGEKSYESWDANREFPYYAGGSWNVSSNFLRSA